MSQNDSNNHTRRWMKHKKQFTQRKLNSEAAAGLSACPAPFNRCLNIQQQALRSALLSFETGEDRIGSYRRSGLFFVRCHFQLHKGKEFWNCYPKQSVSEPCRLRQHRHCGIRRRDGSIVQYPREIGHECTSFSRHAFLDHAVCVLHDRAPSGRDVHVEG